MTSADTLIEALLSEAHETAEKIIQDAKKTFQGTLEEQRKKGRERARDIVSSIDKKAQNNCMIIKLRNKASAENKAKKLILEKKHALIENVLNQVKDELRTLVKTDKYIHVLENLILEGGINLGAKDLELRTRIKTDKYVHVLENFIVEGGLIAGATNLEVILNERDSTLQLDLDKLAEKIGEKTGSKTTITKSAKKIDVIGGAIIQTTGEDKSKDYYENNSSLQLITETNTFTKFRKVIKNFAEKQTLPNIEDAFKLKVLEDFLNDFKKIDSLEDHISEFSIKSTTAKYLGDGKIVLNNTFEGMLNNSEREIRFKIAQILFT